LFSGLTPIHRTVQRLSHSCWSQVGIVIYLPISAEPLLFECTSIPLGADIESGECNTGVRTTLLKSRVRGFDGVVAVRKLQPPLDGPSIDELAAFRRTVLTHAFNFSMLDSRKTLRRSHKEWDGSSFTCASLVAAAYQKVWAIKGSIVAARSLRVMKRPPSGPLPNNVVPGDFDLDDKLALEKRYALGVGQ
jgi:hypothetical protein